MKKIAWIICVSAVIIAPVIPWVGCSRPDPPTTTSIEIPQIDNESGNKIRVIFFTSSERCSYDKQVEIIPRVQDFINTDHIEVIKINEVHSPGGYLISATVYYRRIIEKENKE